METKAAGIPTWISSFRNGIRKPDGCSIPWTTFGGINTAHYLNYDRAKAACEGLPSFRRWDYTDQQIKTNTPPTIYMPTEFLHGLYDGGAGAGLEDYWQIMSQSKVLGGGFIWALWMKDFASRPAARLMWPATALPMASSAPIARRKPAFTPSKKSGRRLPPVSWAIPASNVTFEIENHYSFTSTESCRFMVQIQNFAQPDGDQEILRRRTAAKSDPRPFHRGARDSCTWTCRTRCGMRTRSL